MFDRHGIASNIGAGITVALVALPLNLALALACGLPPSVGLLTGAIAGVIGGLLGASKFQITGPEVALAPITLEVVSRHGYSGLIVVTFLAGLMQIGLGVLRVGRVVNAIPVPVIGGFLAAVGLLVFDSQLPRLLGMPDSVRLVSEIRDPAVLGELRPTAGLLGAGVIALLVLLPRVNRRIPVQLVGVAAAVAAVSWFGLRVPTIQPIDSAWPSLQFPSLASVDVVALLPEAVALALLASIDSLLCAVSVDVRTGGPRIRTDQELVAQGFANMASASFGGMPVAAAVVRSMAAVEAGASSRLASITQAVVLGGVLLVLAPLVSYVPVVALAAILLVIGFRLINYRQLAELWRVARFEAAVFLITAVSIVVTDFVTGVATGVIVALAHFARQQRLALRPREPEPRKVLESGSQWIEAGKDNGACEPEPRLVRLEGPLFFGSQDRLEEALHDVEGARDVVMDLSSVTSIDVSGATALAVAIERLAERGVRIELRVRRTDHALDWVLDRCRKKGVTVADALGALSGSALPISPGFADGIPSPVAAASGQYAPFSNGRERKEMTHEPSS